MMLFLRVPGGELSLVGLAALQDFAQTYGAGTVRLTTRQGIGLPLRPDVDAAEVQKAIANLTAQLEASGLGGINVMACGGATHCRRGLADTAALARLLDEVQQEGGGRLRLGISGCANDCGQSRLQDIGIIACRRPQIHHELCHGCGVCVKTCAKQGISALDHHATEGLTLDHDRCVGCGKCIIACPTDALTPGSDLGYQIRTLGNTSKMHLATGRLLTNWLAPADVPLLVKRAVSFANAHRQHQRQALGEVVAQVGYHLWAEVLLNPPDDQPVLPT